MPTAIPSSPDGYGNDAYTWGRDTTQAEDKIIPYRLIRLEYRRTFRQHHSRRRGHAAEQFPELQPDGRAYGTVQLSGQLGFSPHSRLFMDRKPYSNFIFADPFDYFYTPVSEFQFTNTLSPITKLVLPLLRQQAGRRRPTEELISPDNINKISGIGFKLDYLTDAGITTTKPLHFSTVRYTATIWTTATTCMHGLA